MLYSFFRLTEMGDVLGARKSFVYQYCLGVASYTKPTDFDNWFLFPPLVQCNVLVSQTKSSQNLRSRSLFYNNKQTKQHINNNGKQCWGSSLLLLSCCVVLDTCYVLSFAIIMLNTSLHNPSVKDKPTVDRFIAMNRGINEGGDLPRELLEVFTRLLHRVIYFNGVFVVDLWHTGALPLAKSTLCLKDHGLTLGRDGNSKILDSGFCNPSISL